MRVPSLACLGIGCVLLIAGCARGGGEAQAPAGQPAAARSPAANTDPPSGPGTVHGLYRGFDRNDYPGDDAMAALHRSFAFTGYWLTDPPGEDANTWTGKRSLLRAQGWGFLVLANGRLDAEILKAQRRGTAPAALGRSDAALALAAARREGFPPGTVLFLDQEEGGGMLDEQAAYLLAWTEAVAASGFRAGLYASGQPVPNGPHQTVTTIDDVRARIAAGHLHPVTMFDYQDACPPAPGCTLQPRPLSTAGEPDLTLWQYAQSPRRRAITQACAATYAADGNCYAPGFPTLFLDLDAADSDDPSHGR